MRTNAAILFIIIILPLMIMKNIETNQLKKSEVLANRYDRIVASALDDANVAIANDMYTYNNQIDGINKELAAETFFRSLAINFGVEDDPIGFQILKAYIPCVIVLDHDGYYISSMTEYADGTGGELIDHLFSEKRYYARTDADNNTIIYTLTDEVTVVLPDKETIYSGIRGEVYTTISTDYTPDDIDSLADQTQFDDTRRITITSVIMKDLERIINKHNIIALKHGINYTFTIPSGEDGQLFGNTFDDVGIIAFIQGIPIGRKVYNNAAFAGAKIINKKPYYGNEVIKGTLNLLTYHKGSGIKGHSGKKCSLITDNDDMISFTSKEKAALSGYIPCTECRP